MASVTRILNGIYHDPFKWSLVKSIAIFGLGVKIALECQGFDLMPPITT